METHFFHVVLQDVACSTVDWVGEVTEDLSAVTCKKCLDLIALWQEPVTFSPVQVNMKTAYANLEEDGSIKIYGIQGVFNATRS